MITLSIKRLAIAFSILLASVTSFAQVGNLIWEENFENLDNWILESGNGYWGWGNGELQFYKPENVAVGEIPGEPGSNGLIITAKQESGPGIVDQWGNPLFYTSGRLNTKSKVSVKYGMIETRVSIPDIDLGGWPAIWLLGTTNYSWPRKGEIDMMEMGYNKAFRDLHDDHNGGNGQNKSSVNQMVGANAIFYADEAITPENPLGAASLSWDPEDEFCRPYYNYSPSLVNRYLVYRIYWDEESIRFTVTDNGVEYDLYTEPFFFNEASTEFQHPFYLIANFAVGGLFTDAYSLGNPGSGLPVSMPFPTEMYVDYIRIYEWNGQGEVHLGPPAFEAGTYGIFTDETPVNNSLQPGEDAHIYVWEGTLSAGSIPPFEGENVLSFNTTGMGWFGAGVMSVQPVNLFDFGDGFLKFMIKIPAAVSFKIGIIDAWGNQNYVDFPAHQTTYGLQRNGDWGQASIPVADIRGEFIDLRMLSYEFVILEVNGASCHFAIDDIYWEVEHFIKLNEGWQGISSYIMPVNNTISDMFDPLLPDFILAQTMSGIYYPAGPVNTINNWNSQSAYKVKMDAPANFMVIGDEEPNKTFALANGWNLVPVICNQPVDAARLFAGTSLALLKEIGGLGIYWPEMNINTLGDMLPGKAYLALSGVGTITFPANAKNHWNGSFSEVQFPDHPWRQFAAGPSSHNIGILQKALATTMPGDIIGVLDETGNCFGVAQIINTHENMILSAFADDQLENLKNGFTGGELMQLQLYRPSTSETFDLEVTWDESRPNDRYFENEGISVVTGLKLSATGISTSAAAAVQLYPNPTTGILAISGLQGFDQLEIYNATGNLLMTLSTGGAHELSVNLSTIPAGIYQIRLSGSRTTAVKKLIKN